MVAALLMYNKGIMLSFSQNVLRYAAMLRSGGLELRLLVTVLKCAARAFERLSWHAGGVLLEVPLWVGETCRSSCSIIGTLGDLVLWMWGPWDNSGCIVGAFCQPLVHHWDIRQPSLVSRGYLAIRCCIAGASGNPRLHLADTPQPWFASTVYFDNSFVQCLGALCALWSSPTPLVLVPMVPLCTVWPCQMTRLPRQQGCQGGKGWIWDAYMVQSRTCSKGADLWCEVRIEVDGDFVV